MKKLLILLVLLFSSAVFADDISDFQIEGISIKDSMLDFLSEKQIKNNTKDFYRTDDFIPVQIEVSYFNSEMYDVIEFNYKSGYKNYIIYSVCGLNYPKDINDCYKAQKEILEEFNEQRIKKKNNYFYRIIFVSNFLYLYKL